MEVVIGCGVGCDYLLLTTLSFGKRKGFKNENAIINEQEFIVTLLHGVTNVSEASFSASNTEIKLTHPKIKGMYERLVTIVERLISTIREELASLQLRLTDESDKEDVVEAISSEDDEKNSSENEETSRDEKGEGSDFRLEDDRAEQTEDKSCDAAIEEDKREGNDEEGKDEMNKEAQQEIEVRRSTQVRSRAIKSPWLK
ncbi:uncharacterized protein LOC114717498 [Neltuma alba]|uniref:uncharacterized protein LOC114717498 n=1 Tax=Neltuma alba TaxID=207710 RepID=UPI0010A5603D|nr:uncharacterized protein LOC114717498 [Prosopis alba]